MYVIEHALLNLVKNKGRNILLGVIILAIITAAVVTLAIYNATGVAIEETRAALLCVVRVGPRMRTVGPGTQSTGSSGGAQSAATGMQSAGGGSSVQSEGGGGAQSAGSREQITGTGGQDGQISLDEYLLYAESEYLDGSDISDEPIYYLKHPDMLAAFEAELRSKGMPDSYAARTDIAAFERLTGPVESLKNLTLTFLIIVLILGATIMVLLSLIAIRERKYEIGVLRAMGMKKKSVVMGLWVEIIAITCICFVIGMSCGAALSQPVSNAILTSQAQPRTTGSTTLADRLNAAEQTQPAHVNITINAVTALQIFTIAILLASFSGLVSVSRITRSEPIKILMQRS